MSCEKISLKRFCFPVTLRCNLKCRLCAEHAPYYEKPYHPTISYLQEQVELLFSHVSFIEKFDITGGEPLLQKDLHLLIEYLFSNWKDQIGVLRLTTNGTILPPNQLLQSFEKWGNDFFLIIDHYDHSKKATEVARMAEAYHIPFSLRDYSVDLHCDGWVDYGDFSKKHSLEEAKKVFKKCAIPQLDFFTCMVDGKIFPCSRARLLYENNIESVYVDCKKTEWELPFGEEVAIACQYCNGLCHDSPRYRPAEQL